MTGLLENRTISLITILQFNFKKFDSATMLICARRELSCIIHAAHVCKISASSRVSACHYACVYDQHSAAPSLQVVVACIATVLRGLHFNAFDSYSNKMIIIVQCSKYCEQILLIVGANSEVMLLTVPKFHISMPSSNFILTHLKDL